MNVNETNLVGKSMQVSSENRATEQIEQKKQNPPSIWLHDDGDGYFQIEDIKARTDNNGSKLNQKFGVKNEFLKKFSLEILECVNKPLEEVQSKVEGYIKTFLEEKAKAEAKEAEILKREEAYQKLMEGSTKESTEESSKLDKLPELSRQGLIPSMIISKEDLEQMVRRGKL